MSLRFSSQMLSAFPPQSAHRATVSSLKLQGSRRLSACILCTCIVSFDSLNHIVTRRRRVAFQQGFSCKYCCRGAEAALECAMLDEFPLYRAEDAVFGDPSIVVILCPFASTASTRQDFTGVSSSSTVQSPQSPRSHAVLVPVSPSLCRSTHSRVLLDSVTTLFSIPLTVSLIVCSANLHCLPQLT